MRPDDERIGVAAAFPAAPPGLWAAHSLAAPIRVYSLSRAPSMALHPCVRARLIPFSSRHVPAQRGRNLGPAFFYFLRRRHSENVNRS